MSENAQTPATPIVDNAALMAKAEGAEMAAKANAAALTKSLENVNKEPANEREAPKVDKVSSQFAALAKKEKAIQAQQRALKQQQAEIQAKLEEVTRFTAVKSEAKQNPLKALQELGLSYEEITQYILNGNAPTPESKVDTVTQRLEAMEKKLQEERDLNAKQQQEKTAAEQTQAVADFKAEIAEHVTANPETYELISLYNATDAVYQAVEDYYAAYQKVLSIEEACDAVENYLFSEAEKVLKTKKLASKSQTAEAASPARPAATQPSKTLSNVTSSVPSMLPPKNEAERLQRALAKLGG